MSCPTLVRVGGVFQGGPGGVCPWRARGSLLTLWFPCQAKERELELKNSWAENKLSRRQTQAKYGF